MNTENMTWAMFDGACDKIISRLNKMNRQFSGVCAIPKGGFPLAVVLCNRMNLPFTALIDDNTIIVDDIADTGETLYPYYKKYVIVTLYYKKGSKTIPDIWIYEKKDKWVKFPWE